MLSRRGDGGGGKAVEAAAAAWREGHTAQTAVAIAWPGRGTTTSRILKDRVSHLFNGS